jgi:hypothetical protein
MASINRPPVAHPQMALHRPQSGSQDPHPLNCECALCVRGSSSCAAAWAFTSDRPPLFIATRP